MIIYLYEKKILGYSDRVIGIAKNEFSKGEVSTYEDLATPNLRVKFVQDQESCI